MMQSPAGNSEVAFPALRLEKLRRVYRGLAAVDEVSLSVRPSEFVTLLGPSGSGKTTTLRMVAGFTAPTSGTIELGGRDITLLPPERRDVGMVFQNYALFPHMTAAQNIAFPLQMQRLRGTEVEKRVGEALALVRLSGLGGRYPRELSGGQQQRVALARAVVFHPRVLLMDEPLGALDKKLRESLQLEILEIRHRLKITVMYVTHDQDEALGMSDRIAVFNHGRIEQIGTAEELYERPASLFVAEFVGESTILSGRWHRDGAGAWLVGPLGRWQVNETTANSAGLQNGAEAALVIPADRLQLVGRADARPETNSVEATVAGVLYLGSNRKIDLRLPNGSRAVVREPTYGIEYKRSAGELVRIVWAPDQGVVLPGTAARSSLEPEVSASA